ncbi:MAG: leucyl/phenylalanyl-tRNA--protein transferase [Candidatus Nanopelagicales bacterium]
MPALPPPTAWALPDPADAEPGEELLAVGADLEPGTLLAAYARGLFPMDVGRRGPVGWWSPDPRGVVPLTQFRPSRSLRRSMRRYDVTVDTDFAGVVAGCADPGRPHGWITPAFAAAYGELHRLGWAHSVEVRDDDGRLVGGLYGVEVGGLFAAESKFHRATDASKVALAALVAVMAGAGDPADRVLDVQWVTPHLASLGAVAIPRPEYLRRLAVALRLPPAVAGLAGQGAPGGSRTR